MKATEAMELTKGSMKRKGIIFRIKLAWLCGVLNHTIENNAKLGESKAELTDINKRTSQLYFPLMAKYYEADGYVVYYMNKHTYYNTFVVFWNKEEIPRDLKYAYDYYTKENKNESNC